MDDGWLKQPHLDGSDWTLGLGEAAQVQPAVSTTHSGRGLLDGNMEPQVMYRDPPSCTTNRSLYSPTLNPLSGGTLLKYQECGSPLGDVEHRQVNNMTIIQCDLYS